MPQADINYLAVLVAAVVNMVLGAIWYAPPVFGRTWMALVGKTEADIRRSSAGRAYAITAVVALILSYVLAHFVDYTKATTLVTGAQTGFWLWLGFVATVSAGGFIFEGRPVRLYLLNNGYNLVSLVVMGTILAAWA